MCCQTAKAVRCDDATGRSRISSGAQRIEGPQYGSMRIGSYRARTSSNSSEVIVTRLPGATSKSPPLSVRLPPPPEPRVKIPEIENVASRTITTPIRTCRSYCLKSFFHRDAMEHSAGPSDENGGG